MILADALAVVTARMRRQRNFMMFHLNLWFDNAIIVRRKYLVGADINTVSSHSDSEFETKNRLSCYVDGQERNNEMKTHRRNSEQLILSPEVSWRFGTTDPDAKRDELVSLEQCSKKNYA
jgi:hypothetical protein